MTKDEKKIEEMAKEFIDEMVNINRRSLKGAEVLLNCNDIDVGSTPYEVVFQEDKMRVLYYDPKKSGAKETYNTPLLIVYALINRQYMMDLQPDRSMLKKLLEAGIEVYMIDWGYPTKSDKFLVLEDYIRGYINNAVDFIRKRSGNDKINLMGVCQGGTFSSIYTALYPEKIKNFIPIVAPFDFDIDDGLLFIWSKKMNIQKVVESFDGLVSGDFMNVGFLLLNPFRLMVGKYAGFMEHFDDQAFVQNFLRMEKWIFDSPAQAGSAFLEFIEKMYKQNQLVENKLYIGDKKIDLKRITMPVLNIYAKYDHLVPPSSSKPLKKLVNTDDYEEVELPVGHIGIFVSSKSQNDLCPKIIKWIKAHP